MTHHNKTRTVLALAAAITVSVYAQAQNVPPTTTDPSLGGQSSSSSHITETAHTQATHKDSSFVKEAIEDNKHEIALAEVAQQKAQSQQVKDLAKQLQDDHTAANQQLTQIAQSMAINVDREVSSKENKELAKFNKMNSAEFDKEFAEMTLKDHQKDIEKYHKASQKIQNPQLKEYVITTLPKLHKHFHHAEEVAKAVGVDEKTIASYADKLPPAVGGTSDESSSGTSKSQGSSTDRDDLKSPKDKSSSSY